MKSKKRYPFIRDILNELNPNSPANWVTIQKGQSCGKSSCIIDAEIGYIIHVPPLDLSKFALNNIL